MHKSYDDWSYQFASISPTVIGFVGPNGSGKSSIVQAAGFTGVMPGDQRFKGQIVKDPDTGRVLLPIVNADEIAKAIAATHPQLTEDECNVRAFVEAEQIRQLYARAKIDFAFETVGSHPSKVEFLHALKAAGYNVGVLFVSTEDPEINVRRVGYRVSIGGHGVPVEKVKSRYERTMQLLPQYFMAADYMAIYDNSVDHYRDNGIGPQLLLTKKKDTVTITSAGQASTWLIDRLGNML